MEVSGLVTDFAIRRYQNSVARGGLAPEVDPKAFTLGYATAIFDFVEHVMFPQLTIPDPNDNARVFSAVVVGIFRAIAVGLAHETPPVLEDAWKVPES